jgi:uncharacterized protein YjbI with pentapeptide repeats
VAGRSDRSVHGGRVRLRQPTAPDLPAELTAATLPDDDLKDGGVYLTLAFDDLDLSGRDAVGAEIDQCRYGNVNLSQSKLRRAMIRDAVFDRCDMANLRARDCMVSRTALGASRMTGLSWLDGGVRDVTFTDCRMDLVSFRASTFKYVVFAGCRLQQAEFGDADLSGARFERCDLSGAQFSGARLTGTRFSGCDLTEIGGVTSLRGAIITSADAMALAFTLASALGITISDE